ncbi:putative bifunctional diguanylate cyclase/phosphodiesterase [Legionella israelensis]|uniref:putative bifunctional diguanylate cyclase/phosphodiesterase n=1 Tax=Legionella israelensis TaxID=454 RepID=UPI001FD4E936|nr:EAL domain-containing protein [Legionella israelensis]
MNKKKNNYWPKLLNALAEGVVIINKEGEILFINAYAANMLGHPVSDLLGSNFLYPLAEDETQEIEIIKPDGEILPAQMTVKKGAWENDVAWVISLQDISEFKAKEKMLSISSKGISSAFEGIIITDANGTILEANKAFLKMTGFKKEEIIGKNPRIWKSGYQSAEFYKQLWSALIKRGHWSGELWDKYKHNKLYPVFLSISAVKNSEGDITNYIGFFHDLSVIKEQEEQIEHFKFYDFLTGLPNKFLLTQRLDNYIEQSWNIKSRLIVISIRIFDPGKQNSSYNESAEIRDEIILKAIERIERWTYGKKLLSRIGYSEFIVVYFGSQKIESMESVAKKIIHSLSKPYRVKNKKYTMQSIIGITSLLESGAFSGEDLLNQTEIARHKAMQKGFNQFDFFDAESEKQTLIFHQRIEALRKAIKQNQLELHYQPKVDLSTGKVIGAEALLRWIHPDKHLLMPSDFLAGLDKHPVSIELGDWVLNQALKLSEKLIKNNLNIPISINISSYQLEDKNFTKHLEETLSKYPHLPKSCIMLEILETEALEDLERISNIINDCKTKGILFSLDDFGTGYSSLTYLKDLNTAEVKLDQSFVRNVLSKPKDLSILKTTIELCRLIDRDLIAEGVETIIHGKLLRHLGCHYIQGYVITKPIPEQQLIPWLNKWTLGKEWQKDRFSKEELDELIFLSIEHYLSFEALRRYLERNHQELPDFSFEHCPINYWLLKHKKGMKDGDTFKVLHQLHKKQHAMANHILQLKIKGKKEQALEKLKELDDLLSILLVKLITAIFEP